MFRWQHLSDSIEDFDRGRNRYQIPCRSAQPMSQLGQTHHFDGAPLTSGLPQLADILWGSRHVSKVP
jgi:hypothetical protein